MGRKTATQRLTHLPNHPAECRIGVVTSEPVDEFRSVVELHGALSDAQWASYMPSFSG